MELRQLGTTDIYVSPVALGCWPISGMTSVGITEADSLATIAACFDLGINFLDTAYCYGRSGESEQLIRRALGKRRDQIVIATKGAIHWGEGKTRSVGLSNATVTQLEEFIAVCPLAAYQPHYNMLQREIEADTLPWCQRRQVSVVVYWPLLKGLLAGKLARDHVFAAGDGRAKYPMFQGGEWQKNQDLVDDLREIAADAGRSVAQLVINWTIHRSGITAALCGAKRPDQVRENAGGMGWQMNEAMLARIDAALARRGEAISRAAV